MSRWKRVKSLLKRGAGDILPRHSARIVLLPGQHRVPLGGDSGQQDPPSSGSPLKNPGRNEQSPGWTSLTLAADSLQEHYDIHLRANRSPQEQTLARHLVQNLEGNLNSATIDGLDKERKSGEVVQENSQGSQTTVGTLTRKEISDLEVPRDRVAEEKDGKEGRFRSDSPNAEPCPLNAAEVALDPDRIIDHSARSDAHQTPQKRTSDDNQEQDGIPLGSSKIHDHTREQSSTEERKVSVGTQSHERIHHTSEIQNASEENTSTGTELQQNTDESSTPTSDSTIPVIKTKTATRTNNELTEEQVAESSTTHLPSDDQASRTSPRSQKDSACSVRQDALLDSHTDTEKTNSDNIKEQDQTNESQTMTNGQSSPEPDPRENIEPKQSKRPSQNSVMVQADTSTSRSTCHQEMSQGQIVESRRVPNQSPNDVPGHSSSKEEAEQDQDGFGSHSIRASYHCQKTTEGSTSETDVRNVGHLDQEQVMNVSCETGDRTDAFRPNTAKRKPEYTTTQAEAISQEQHVEEVSLDSSKAHQQPHTQILEDESAETKGTFDKSQVPQTPDVPTCASPVVRLSSQDKTAGQTLGSVKTNAVAQAKENVAQDSAQSLEQASDQTRVAVQDEVPPVHEQESRSSRLRHRLRRQAKLNVDLEDSNPAEIVPEKAHVSHNTEELISRTVDTNQQSSKKQTLDRPDQTSFEREHEKALALPSQETRTNIGVSQNIALEPVAVSPDPRRLDVASVIVHHQPVEHPQSPEAVKQVAELGGSTLQKTSQNEVPELKTTGGTYTSYANFSLESQQPDEAGRQQESTKVQKKVRRKRRQRKDNRRTRMEPIREDLSTDEEREWSKVRKQTRVKKGKDQQVQPELQQQQKGRKDTNRSKHYDTA